jgi:hypothetical protein
MRECLLRILTSQHCSETTLERETCYNVFNGEENELMSLTTVPPQSRWSEAGETPTHDRSGTLDGDEERPLAVMVGQTRENDRANSLCALLRIRRD